MVDPFGKEYYCKNAGFLVLDIDDFDEFHVSNCPDKITYKGIHFIVESEMVQFIEDINVKGF
jgi:hypothetical protein